jgi:hypothetical protein
MSLTNFLPLAALLLKVKFDAATVASPVRTSCLISDACEVERSQVQDEIVNLRDTANLQEYGLFDFENPAESSVALATELESVRSEIFSLDPCKLLLGGRDLVVKGSFDLVELADVVEAILRDECFESFVLGDQRLGLLLGAEE